MKKRTPLKKKSRKKDSNSEKSLKSDAEDESEDWFRTAHPGAKSDFPKILVPSECVVYSLTIKEDEPRIVRDKFRKTAVIEVEYEGEERSLFLGHRYLAQKIHAIQQRKGTLLNVKISLHRLRKTKNYIVYDVNEI